MGDEQAETYLRLLAESESRRAMRRSGGVAAADIARSLEQLRWAGGILVEAGALEDDAVDRMAAELEAALLTRSGMGRPGRLNWAFERTAAPPAAGPPQQWWGTAQPMRITPFGQTIGVGHGRAPSDLHLMTLVRSPDGVSITAAMRMHWPADGSSADLEITGAGPEHLPYDQLWAADDRGTRYRVVMIGEGGTLAWQGALLLHGTVPPDARWLDLVADGTRRLLRIDLERGDTPTPATAEPVPAVPGGERMLAAAAERILASAWDTGGPRADERLGETITVLAAAGAIADSPTPGQLAALCQRLGVAGHGITAPAAARIPGRWAEVLPPRPAGPAGALDRSPEWFVPLRPAAADLEGTRFAFAGLTTAGEQSFLHMVATGMPPLPAHRHDTGFSWRVRDDSGRWHLAMETDPHARERGQIAFRLRLTPPLRVLPEEIEVIVTGRLSRVRAVIPVEKMPDT